MPQSSQLSQTSQLSQSSQFSQPSQLSQHSQPSQLSHQKNHPTMKIGIFVGSFDPFTTGHHAIVRRALPLFDKIVIGVGINERKKYMYSTRVRLQHIEALYASEPKIEVKSYNDLTIDFAGREGAQFIIKGVRSIKDFEYEREQADINRKIGGVDTILLYAEPQYESVSSSMVRELIHFGKDASEFIPVPPQEQHTPRQATSK